MPATFIQGFLAVYKTLRDSVKASLEGACQGCDWLLVTGHSLGAALALLAAPDIAKNILAFGRALAASMSYFAEEGHKGGNCGFGRQGLQRQTQS